jgi:hypothetical protein
VKTGNKIGWQFALEGICSPLLGEREMVEVARLMTRRKNLNKMLVSCTWFSLRVLPGFYTAMCIELVYSLLGTIAPFI